MAQSPEPEPRAHHYVPQCWLAGFTDSGRKDGRLWVTDLHRRKQWPTSPPNAGHRRDFYRVSSPEHDPVIVEKLYSKIEYGVAPAENEAGMGWISHAHRISSPGSGAALGAVRRNFIKPAPVAFPARFLKKSAAVSTTPTFWATAEAIHWFKETPSSFAKRCAAFLIETGSFNG